MLCYSTYVERSKAFAEKVNNATDGVMKFHLKLTEIWDAKAVILKDPSKSDILQKLSSKETLDLYQQSMEFAKKASECEEKSKRLDKLKEQFFQFSIGQFLRYQEIHANLQRQNEEPKGLSPETLQTFNLCTADESFLGRKCGICLEEIAVGRRIWRLTCDGQHTFCEECIQGWFAEHNTCPTCRHVFH